MWYDIRSSSSTALYGNASEVSGPSPNVMTNVTSDDVLEHAQMVASTYVRDILEPLRYDISAHYHNPSSSILAYQLLWFLILMLIKYPVTSLTLMIRGAPQIGMSPCEIPDLLPWIQSALPTFWWILFLTLTILNFVPRSATSMTQNSGPIKLPKDLLHSWITWLVPELNC